MKPFREEIEEIVQMIWSTLVDLPILPGGEAVRGDDSTVTGIVNIDGAWHGAVFLRCPLALAARVTSSMLQSDDGASLDDVCDALGELTNMVAGNVKALLPHPSVLSLPTVAFGSDYEIGVLGTHIVVSVPFMSESHPLLVSVVQRSDDVGGATR